MIKDKNEGDTVNPQFLATKWQEGERREGTENGNLTEGFDYYQRRTWKERGNQWKRATTCWGSDK